MSNKSASRFFTNKPAGVVTTVQHIIPQRSVGKLSHLPLRPEGAPIIRKVCVGKKGALIIFHGMVSKLCAH